MAKYDPNAPKVYVTFERLSLYAERRGDKGAPKMVFGLLNDNPRITVYTNDPEDKITSGVIAAGFNPEEIQTVFQVIEQIAEGQPGDRKYCCVYKTEYIDGKPTNNKILRNKLYVGKNQQGIVELCLVEHDRPKVMFAIKMSQYHGIKDAKGNDIDEGLASTMATRSLVSILKDLYRLEAIKNLNKNAVRIEKEEKSVRYERKETPIDNTTLDDDIIL